MTNWAEDAEKQYSALAEYAALRTDELGRILQPYIEATDRYGVGVTLRAELNWRRRPTVGRHNRTLTD